jgi:hypothetical protein
VLGEGDRSLEGGRRRRRRPPGGCGQGCGYRCGSCGGSPAVRQARSRSAWGSADQLLMSGATRAVGGHPPRHCCPDRVNSARPQPRRHPRPPGRGVPSGLRSGRFDQQMDSAAIHSRRHRPDHHADRLSNTCRFRGQDMSPVIDHQPSGTSSSSSDNTASISRNPHQRPAVSLSITGYVPSMMPAVS